VLKKTPVIRQRLKCVGCCTWTQRAAPHSGAGGCYN